VNKLSIYDLSGEELTILAALVAKNLAEGLTIDQQILLGRFIQAITEDVFLLNAKLLLEQKRSNATTNQEEDITEEETSE